jgi:hypothetical protein
MDVNYRIAAMFCVVGLALGGARPVAGPAGPGKADKPKSAVAAEAETWLAALRNAGAPDLKLERVLVVDADGQVLDQADGERNTVAFPDRFLRFLRQPTPSVSLVHNHPGNTGLSEPDLYQLGHPGVARVIAVGNDGSLYEARRGAAFDAGTFDRSTYPAAEKALKRTLVQRTEPNVKRDDRINTHFAHALAISLAQAGVLEYRAVLDPQRKAAWNAVRVWYGVSER